MLLEVAERALRYAVVVNSLKILLLEMLLEGFLKTVLRGSPAMRVLGTSTTTFTRQVPV